MTNLRTRAAIFAISAAVTCLFIIDLCGLIYGCGCRSWWAGAADHCNIHHAGPPHCPWCQMGSSGFVLVLAIILVAQAVASFANKPPRLRSPVAQLVISLSVFPAMAVILGYLIGWWKDYPMRW